MTPEELYAIWLRCLAARNLAPGEKRELLQAMEADPELRSRILSDAEIDGLLRMVGATEQDAESFVKAISDFLAAESDASGFVGRVESRMAKEGILPGLQGKPDEARADEDHKKLRPGFGIAGSMQYNSSRASMPAIVTLEGSEEDFGRLLVHHRIINPDQLQKALEDRQSHAAKGNAVESLRDVLLRTKLVASPLIFEVLRTATKVVESCIKCSATHHIFYYHPSARYFCTYCKGPLRVIDAGQSMTWKPGELAASIRELHAPMEEAPDTAPQTESKIILPKTASNPLDDPSIATLPAADETMLDMGVTPRTSSKAKDPAPAKPAAPPPPPAAASDGLPSWLNDEPEKALPQDESILDMGITPRSSSKPAPLPKLAKEGEPEKKPSSAPDLSQSVGPNLGGGETMLDMGITPRSTSKPSPLPKLAKEGEPEKKKPAVPDPSQSSGGPMSGGTTILDMSPTPKDPVDPGQSVGPNLGGGETMLDMGITPRSSSKPAAPADPGQPVPPDMGGGETMLDMGVTPPKKHVSDMTTSILGSKKALPTGMPKPPPETPKLPTETNPSYDVTTRATTPSSGVTPRTSSPFSSTDKTQVVQNTTPKSGTGGSSAAIANAKALPPEVAQAAKDPNRVFGKYILMSELGRGGAGVVYKAWDTLLIQWVALKFIRNQDDGDSTNSESGSSQIEEFQREARMSVRLRHPNIVRIYELGCMSNRYYLAMEYIEGGNLLALIHGGKDRNQKTRFNADPIKFLKIMQNIALAVDYAHTSKPPIIHRDLKPHNVLVDTKGNPYVVDFGLAKEVDQGDGATLTGVVKGTPTYMAPEQAEGRNRDVDARTDVYALGAILYEMLTGRPPFTGESVPEILRKIATDLPERPNEVITRNAIAEAASSTGTTKTKTKGLLIPKPLETICLKSIEKGKADRYQSAKEMAEDIDRYLKDEDILAQEPNLYRRIRRKVRQHPILSAAAAALFLAGVTGGIVFKAAGKGNDGSKQEFVNSAVARGEGGLKRVTNGRANPDWLAVKAAASDLAALDKKHPKIEVFETALREYEKLKDKTRSEWRLEKDRIQREPLAQVLPKLRVHYNQTLELQPEFRESLNTELTILKNKVLDEARRLVGSGARPAWVEEVIKKSAREAKEQAESLISLANDPDFKYEVEKLVDEARAGLTQVIEYQGTWALQVNVTPFAEVSVTRADKEVSSDFTPLGLQGLEVVGSSYMVELFWPSRENAQVKVKQEIKDLHHGQTVVIRGDLSKAALKQERQEKK